MPRLDGQEPGRRFVRMAQTWGWIFRQLCVLLAFPPLAAQPGATREVTLRNIVPPTMPLRTVTRSPRAARACLSGCSSTSIQVQRKNWRRRMRFRTRAAATTAVGSARALRTRSIIRFLMSNPPSALPSGRTQASSSCCRSSIPHRTERLLRAIRLLLVCRPGQPTFAMRKSELAPARAAKRSSGLARSRPTISPAPFPGARSRRHRNPSRSISSPTLSIRSICPLLVRTALSPAIFASTKSSLALLCPTFCPSEASSPSRQAAFRRSGRIPSRRNGFSLRTKA